MEDLRHGDFFASPRPDFGIVIFGKVLEHTKYPEDSESIRRGRARGYVYCMAYSPLCVEGEFGDIHITRIAVKIPSELFERARANGWRHLEASD